MGAGQTRPESWRPHERLRKSKEIERVYEAREVYRATSVSLYCYRQKDLERKAAFVAGRKVGKATARNRSRRMMREAFRRIKQSVVKKGVHLVFVAREGCASRTYHEIRGQVVELVDRAGLLTEPVD